MFNILCDRKTCVERVSRCGSKSVDLRGSVAFSLAQTGLEPVQVVWFRFSSVYRPNHEPEFPDGKPVPELDRTGIKPVWGCL